MLQQYDDQRHRGTQGFGLFDGQEMNMVKEANEDKILNWLCKYDSNLILFHHRFPTSTINVKRAAHPFTTKDFFGDTQYITVHNGVIYNKHTLKAKHDKLGITYQSLLHDGTYNDSEALAWELALTFEGRQEQIEAEGDIAFITLKIVDGVLERMLFARNVRPLNMFREKGGLALSSEGAGDPIEPQVLYNWNYAARRLTKKLFAVPVKTYPAWNSGNQGGNWLSDDLQKKYSLGKYTPNPYSSNYYDYEEEEDDYQSGVELEYDHETQLYLPIRSDTITMSEIEDLMFKYLFRAHGNFETAFWLMEKDQETEQDKRHRSLINEAIDYLSQDEEWVGSESVSSAWRQAWEA